MLSKPKSVQLADGTRATLAKTTIYRVSNAGSSFNRVDVAFAVDRRLWIVRQGDGTLIDLAETEEQAESLAFRHLGIIAID